MTPADEPRLINLYDVAELEMVVISVDGLGPPDSPALTFSPARRALDLASDPIRVAVVLPRPANVLVHLRGTNPTGGKVSAILSVISGISAGTVWAATADGSNSTNVVATR